MEPAITAVGAMGASGDTKANAWIGVATVEGDHLVIRLPEKVGFLPGDVVVRENDGRLIVERRKLNLLEVFADMEPLEECDAFPDVKAGLLPLSDDDRDF